jgi:hypothetical protein
MMSSRAGSGNFLYFLLFLRFSKIYVSSQILQNYIITAMWYGVWVKTRYHTAFAAAGNIAPPNDV